MAHLSQLTVWVEETAVLCLGPPTNQTKPSLGVTASLHFHRERCSVIIIYLCVVASGMVVISVLLEEDKAVTINGFSVLTIHSSQEPVRTLVCRYTESNKNALK